MERKKKKKETMEQEGKTGQQASFKFEFFELLDEMQNYHSQIKEEITRSCGQFKFSKMIKNSWRNSALKNGELKVRFHMAIN